MCRLRAASTTATATTAAASPAAGSDEFLGGKFLCSNSLGHHPPRLLADFLGSELPWWMFYDMGVIYYGVLHLLFSALTRSRDATLATLATPDEHITCSHAVDRSGIQTLDTYGEFCSSTASRAAYEHEPTGRGTSLGRWHIGCTSFEQWVTTSISSPSVADPEGSPAQKDLVRPRPASRARHRARCTLIRHCLLTLPVSLISLLYGHSGSIWQER